MTTLQYLSSLESKSDKAINGFLSGVNSAQSGMYNRVLSLIKGLELGPSGNVLSNTSNLKILNQVRSELSKEILTDSYISKVDRFVGSFQGIKSTNDAYFSSLTSTFNPGKLVYKDALKTSMQLVSDSLLESGINERVIGPAKQIIADSITGRWSYTDLVENLRTTMKGDPETLGALERYAKQITADSLNQFSANYNQSVSEDLGFEWYLYSGGKRVTSRPFCVKFSGKYYHKKEIEDFGKGVDVDGGGLSRDLLKGRIRGTNASNIFTYRGGYSCQHQFVPVGIDQVPKYVVKRNVEKGYYSPE